VEFIDRKGDGPGVPHVVSQAVEFGHSHRAFPALGFREVGDKLRALLS
jgi:hypothetical protein